jgi:hypothetical protein
MMCTRYIHDRRRIATLSISILHVRKRQAEANMLPRQRHTRPLIDSPQQGGFVKRVAAVPGKIDQAGFELPRLDALFAA